MALYADGRDPRDPLLSPIYGEVTGFPPAILTSGTRDLYLSNAVRMHRSYPTPCACTESFEGQAWRRYCKCGKASRTRNI